MSDAINASARLGIVDNDPLSLAALSSYIAKQLPAVSIAWAASDPQRGVEYCRRDAVDVLLTDMSMSGISGPTLIRQVRQRDSRVIIIAMTSFPLHEYANQAARSGAQAIVSKRCPSQIIDSLARACAGRHPATPADGAASGVQAAAPQPVASSAAPAPHDDDASVPFLPPKEAHHRLVHMPPTGIDRLTDLEQRITELCRQGLTSAQIGARIDMTAATVNTHLARACAKVGARNRVQLVAMWIEHNESPW